jgi:hypothetical protein
MILSDPQATDPSTWAYASEVLATEYGQESNRPNVVRVVGATISTTTAWSEAVDENNVLLTGSERFLLIVDRMLDTSAKCLQRATSELRQIQRIATHGGLVVALNPQHELADVITFSDAAIGVEDTAMRISGVTWTYSGGEALYQQQLRLEAP